MIKAFVPALALLIATSALAQTQPATYAEMQGTWTVDLRLALTDEPYTQPMVLNIAADKTVTGTFYNSEILVGKAGMAQGRACVAFRTTDGSGEYHSTACLQDGKMIGTTWAEGRAFVLPWTAER